MKQGALDFIRQVGCIQYDPIDVCGKNSELVLQSRVKGLRWKFYSMYSILLISNKVSEVNTLITIDIIKAVIDPLTKKYDISQIDLFGSYANGNATKKSDVDLLVKFVIPIPSIFAVMGFQEELSRKLKIPVDVVTFPLTHPEKLNIEKTIRIYEK